MGTVLAYAATYDDKFAVSIPKYGAERRGAPVQNSVKIGDSRIRKHAQITNPSDIISLDVTLVPRMFKQDVFHGKGTLTLNSPEIPPAYDIYTPEKFGYSNVQRITEEEGLVRSGTVMTAIPILGSFIKTSGILTLESLHQAIDTVFGKSKLLENNHKAVDRAYKETKVRGEPIPAE